jgi:hypothetical protein
MEQSNTLQSFKNRTLLSDFICYLDAQGLHIAKCDWTDDNVLNAVEVLDMKDEYLKLRGKK